VNALEKRIKRQVTAREHTFFTVVAPGLASVLREELNALFQGRKEILEAEGGLEFQGTVEDCYKANLHLRTASRIIMRIGSISARDFQTLEGKLSEFPWELYLPSGTIPEIRVTVKKSKLYHSDAVAQRIRESLLKKQGWEQAVISPSSPAIHVRGINDRFEISVDSSGELLYKRGLTSSGAKAPLRETLAAGLLRIAGYDGAMPLMDPMCGSGTFSREAALMVLNIPPGWFRNFAFTQWPCFRDGRFRHLRRAADNDIRTLEEPLIFTSDKDQESMDRFETSILSTPLSPCIQRTSQDFFDIEPSDIFSKKGLVIINPPYGLRLGSEHTSKALIRRIFKRFETRYRGWRGAVLSPFDKTGIKAPAYMKQHPVFHGGLSLYLIHGPIPE
jgi:putative N6-adenine-specific DNA methylase